MPGDTDIYFLICKYSILKKKLFYNRIMKILLKARNPEPFWICTIIGAVVPYHEVNLKNAKNIKSLDEEKLVLKNSRNLCFTKLFF